MLRTVVSAAAAALRVATCATAVSAAQEPVVAQIAPAASPLPSGTPIRLMVTKEINSRTSKPGDRFKLRVDEAVEVGGAVVVPIGATAWGEITSAEGTQMAGGKGSLSIRLLYVDLPSGRLPIRGTGEKQGKANTAGVVMGVLSFGLPGLLTKGGNASFKAGDIIIGLAI